MNEIVCVFGGTGFIGAQVVRELCDAGYRVKIAARVPERAFDLKSCGSVGQVSAVPCDNSKEQITAAVKGSHIVLNFIGTLHGKGRNGFHKIHAQVPQYIAQACRAENISRFIHVSALGIDQSLSRYSRSKKEGENLVLNIFPEATILRPSIVFGPGDHFFNRFAGLARLLPALPLIGGGHTKFQPVYVGDVADAVMAAIIDPATRGRIYEIGGPDILTFKQLFEKMFIYTNNAKFLLPVPYGLAKIQGMALGILPNPPLTADQVESLKADNIVQAHAATLQDLGIMPKSLDAILPTYLQQYRPGGRFADKNRHSASAK